MSKRFEAQYDGITASIFGNTLAEAKENHGKDIVTGSKGPDYVRPAFLDELDFKEVYDSSKDILVNLRKEYFDLLMDEEFLAKFLAHVKSL